MLRKLSSNVTHLNSYGPYGYLYMLSHCYYPHLPIARSGMDISVTVCLFFACVFVRLRISPRSIKLAASNFAQWFIGVLGREFPIWGNFASPQDQFRTNRPARPCCNVMLLNFCDSHAYQVRAACGRRIGMCGYTAVPEDRRTCLFIYLFAQW